MWTCKQVSNTLADKRYWNLPLYRKIGLRIHVLLCAVCGRYNRQVIMMQETAHAFAKHELEDPPRNPSECLSPSARERIRKALSEKAESFSGRTKYLRFFCSHPTPPGWIIRIVNSPATEGRGYRAYTYLRNQRIPR